MSKAIARTGILGGSFNPPHAGHLHISELAIKHLKLDEVWWIPTIQNPLKEADIKSSYRNRLKLCRALTKENDSIKIKDFEQRYFESARKFYSYNLLKKLNEKYPNREFYFLMGADSFANLDKWYKFAELPKLARLVVFNRPGYKRRALTSKAAKLRMHYKFIDEEPMDISSTSLRGE